MGETRTRSGRAANGKTSNAPSLLTAARFCRCAALSLPSPRSKLIIHRRRLSEYRKSHPVGYQGGNPEGLRKILARNAVYRALKDGKIYRQPCRCGADKVQAHHADYDKPLEVTWLCAWCHAAEHRAESGAE